MSACAGALSAAVPAAAGPFLLKLNTTGRLVASTVLGGVASVAGGGKFANGAVTGAFGYLFNGAAGKAIGGAIAGWGVGAVAIELGPLDVPISLGARWVGGEIGSWIEDWIFNSQDEGRRLPDDRIIRPPGERGLAPIGDDGYPVELHHRGQNQDSPLDEMTRADHRGGGNFKDNHDGQNPSKIDRAKAAVERFNYWTREWDNGRFDKLPGK